MKKINEINFQQITESILKPNVVRGAIFNVYSDEYQYSSLTGAGNLKENDYYFVASVTKLYVTALILILRNEGKLSLDDPIINFFNENELSGLHVYKGIEYTKHISIRHLLSNQSGIRDYFFYEDKGSHVIEYLNKHDPAWTFDRVLKRVKTLSPRFKPGQVKKVNYSDTNFRFLGEIIERITKLSIQDACDIYLFKPINLKNTFMYQVDTKLPISPMYHKHTIVNAPRYMASVGAEGGLVSKADEVMIFLRAFFNGTYFPKSNLDELKTNYRMILIPGQFYFGTGIEKLWVPRFMSIKKPIKDIIGFWGQSGAFAFYHEETKLYFTGTINQASGFGHGRPFGAMLKVIKAYRKLTKGA